MFEKESGALFSAWARWWAVPSIECLRFYFQGGCLIRVCPRAWNPTFSIRLLPLGKSNAERGEPSGQAMRDFSVCFVQSQWSNLASTNILINCELWLMCFSSVTLSGYGFISDCVIGTWLGFLFKSQVVISCHIACSYPHWGKVSFFNLKLPERTTKLVLFFSKGTRNQRSGVPW